MVCRIFDKMENMDLVSWSAMISYFSHNDQNHRSIIIFNQMLEYGLDLNQFCFSGVIRACSNMENVGIGH